MEILGEAGNGDNSFLYRIYSSVAEPRRGAFRIHHHAACELGLILEGHGVYQAAKNYEIGPGDLFYYGSNEAHCITDIEGGSMTILNLHISPQYYRLLGGAGRAEENTGMSLFRQTFAENKLNLVIPEETIDTVRMLMKRIVSEFEEKSSHYSFMAETCIDQILILLSRYALPEEEIVSVSASGADAVFRSMDYIDDHFAEPMSLELLSGQAGLEKTYYATLFRKTAGMTPWEYLTLKRVENALTMLRSTQCSVLEVALASGFSGTASFNKNFKKYTGLTPRQVRH